MRVALSRAFAVALIAGLAACGGDASTGPGPGGGSGQLDVLRPSSSAPAILTTDTSFIATRGQTEELRLYYAPDSTSGSSTGEEFLRFKLEDGSLLRYPQDHPKAGALFQDGDTITIHVTVVPDSLIVRFEPSGLQFSPSAPALLEMRYPEASRDYNDDGVEDQTDTQLQSQIRIWKQENPGDAWVPISNLSDNDEATETVKAFLTSFTRYALAI